MGIIDKIRSLFGSHSEEHEPSDDQRRRQQEADRAIQAMHRRQ